MWVFASMRHRVWFSIWLNFFGGHEVSVTYCILTKNALYSSGNCALRLRWTLKHLITVISLRPLLHKSLIIVYLPLVVIQSLNRHVHANSCKTWMCKKPVLYSRVCSTWLPPSNCYTTASTHALSQLCLSRVVHIVLVAAGNVLIGCVSLPYALLYIMMS